MEIKWTALAEERVFEIASYISRDSRSEALKWVTRLYDYVDRLQNFPESGRKVPELPERKDMRELIFGNYRIIYKIQDNSLFILTIRNYKQLLRKKEIIP